jgi:hypothetical protein
MIEASRFDPGTAYVVADRHRNDDFAPYVFMTTDYGQTWTSIASDLPAKGYGHVVREDPRNRQLLYAGTQVGVFASWDRGAHWTSIRHNLPAVAAYDLVVHPRDNDLVMATHGRGIYVLDDITPLQQMEEAHQADRYLFDVRPATRYQLWRKDASLGSRTFTAPNPPYGAIIDYYLASDVEGGVTVAITAKSGQPIREIKGPGRRGVNRINWDLRHEPAMAPVSDLRTFGTFGTHPVAYRMGDGPLVVPDDYTVTLNGAGKQLTTSVRVVPDPRVEVRKEDLKAQVDTVLAVDRQISRVNQIVDRTADLSNQLSRAKAAVTATPVLRSIDEVLAQVKVLREKLTRPNAGLQYRQGPKVREELWTLATDLNGGTAAPTAAQRTRLEQLVNDTDELVAELNAMLRGVIPRTNELLGGAQRIVPGDPIR